METEGDDFNKRFSLVNNGDEDDNQEEKDENAPQIVTSDGL